MDFQLKLRLPRLALILFHYINVRRRHSLFYDKTMTIKKYGKAAG
jgi:hypothetical protein